MTIGTDTAGRKVKARRVRVVSGLITTNEVGAAVPVVPIRYVGSAATTDEQGRPVDALQAEVVASLLTADADGVEAAMPVRVVAGTITTNEVGQAVPVLPVYDIGATPTPTPSPTPAPTNSVAPAVSGTEQVGNLLTTTNGTWANTPTSYTYQWQRNTGSWGNISGETGSTYLLVSGDLTYTVRCVVTATNAGGSTSANSNATGVIAASGYTWTAPTVANATDYVAGGPLYVDFAFPAGTDTVGLYLYEQAASDSGFTTALTGEGAIRTDRTLIDATWFADADLDGINDMPARDVLVNQPNGELYYRCWLEEEAADGLSFTQVSAASNVLHVTVSVESASTLDPTKLVSSEVALTNSNMTVTAKTAGGTGSNYLTGATNGRSGLRFFAAVVDATTGGNMGIGLVSSTYDFTLTATNAANVAKRIYWVRTGNVATKPDGTTASMGGTTVPIGSRMYVAYDTVLNKVWFGNSVDGWKNGDPQAGTSGYDLPSNTGTMTAAILTQRTASGQIALTFEPSTAGTLAKPARMSLIEMSTKTPPETTA